MAAKTEEKPETEPSFEQALDQLEAIVGEMESDRLPLDQLLESYEKGNRLYEICRQRLDEARDRIEKIREKSGGDLALEPLDGGEAGEAEESDSSSDGELF